MSQKCVGLEIFTSSHDSSLSEFIHFGNFNCTAVINLGDSSLSTGFPICSCTWVGLILILDVSLLCRTHFEVDFHFGFDFWHRNGCVGHPSIVQRESGIRKLAGRGSLIRSTLSATDRSSAWRLNAVSTPSSVRVGK